MIENYNESIKKWENNIVHFEQCKSNTIEHDEFDRKVHWNRIINKPCGFCREFISDFSLPESPNSCNRCPLSKKHCNTIVRISVEMNSTYRQIKNAYVDGNFVEAIRLSRFAINVMRRHKQLFLS